jgi:hypothetical protein
MTMKVQTITRRAMLQTAAASAIFAPAVARAAVTKVTLGIVNTVSDAPYFIADARGYFKDEGLDVDIASFPSGAKMIASLSTGDLDTLRRVVAPDVRCVSDGGGEYTAAKVPFSGFDRVMAFYVGKARKDGPPDRFALGWYNGAPALLAEHDQVRGKWAPRWVMRLEIGADGLIHRLDSVLTTRKLASVPPLR